MPYKPSDDALTKNEVRVSPVENAVLWYEATRIWQDEYSSSREGPLKAQVFRRLIARLEADLGDVCWECGRTYALDDGGRPLSHLARRGGGVCPGVALPAVPWHTPRYECMATACAVRLYPQPWCPEHSRQFVGALDKRMRRMGPEAHPMHLAQRAQKPT